MRNRLFGLVSVALALACVSTLRGAVPFDSGTSFGVGVRSSSAAVGDVDSDGDLDLIVSGTTDTYQALHLYTNVAGVLTGPLEIGGLPQGTIRGSMLLGDTDLDGDADLVLAGRDSFLSPGLRVFTNNAGVFSAPGYLEMPIMRSSLAMFDADRDGDLDLAAQGVFNDFSHVLFFLYKNENGTLAVDGENSRIGAEGEGLRDSTLVAGDLDNDGDIDLITAGAEILVSDDARLAAYLNNGDGTFAGPLYFGVGMKSSCAAALGDFDADGDLDLVVTGDDNTSQRRLDFYRNRGPGLFEQAVPFGDGVKNASVVTGDMDADGDLDLVIMGRDTTLTRRLDWYANDGTGAFAAPEGFGVGASGGSLSLADFDADGDLDLVVSGRDIYGAPSLSFYANTTSTANVAPAIPGSLQAVGDGGTWTLNWAAPTDDYSPVALLRYHVALGTTSGVFDTVSESVHYPAGEADLGNVTRPPLGSYPTQIPVATSVWWKVLAIDTALKSSGYSATMAAPGGHPHVLSSLPQNGAVGVVTNATLQLVFSEAVVTGSGNIVLWDTEASAPVATISVAGAQVSGSGTDTIVIVPASTFDPATAYHVVVDDTAFSDLSGNPYSGITEDDRWNFRTEDPAAPLVVARVPADNATGVPADTDLSLNFSAPVTPTNGAVLLRRAGDHAPWELVDVTGTNVTGGGTTNIVVKLSRGLDDNTSYYVEVPFGAFESFSGSPFEGESGSNAWNFTAGDETVPYVVSYSPAPGGNDVARDANLVMVFNEPVHGGSGDVTIRRSSDDSLFEAIDVTGAQVSGDGTATITVNPTNRLELGTRYYIEIADTCFSDLSHSFPGIDDSTTWSFKASHMRGPYLQNMRQSSVVIMWRADFLPLPTTGHTVEYGLTPALGSEVTVPPVSATSDMVSVTVSGLMTNTLYYYRVKQDDDVLSRIYNFRTSKPATATDFSFIFFTDTGYHPYHDSYNKPLQKNTAAALKHHIDSRPVDFIVHGGDVNQITGADIYYQSKFFDIYNDEAVVNLLSYMPIYPTIGNHDVPTDAYFDIFALPTDNSPSERYYSFDYGNVHFVALDSNTTVFGDHDPTQLAWFNSNMAATDQHWKFVYFHHGMQYQGSSGPDVSNGHYWGITWEQAFSAHQVDVAAYGHNHVHRRSHPLVATDDMKNPIILDPPEWNRGTIHIMGTHGGYLLSALNTNGWVPRGIIAQDFGNAPGFTRYDVTSTNMTISMYSVGAHLEPPYEAYIREAYVIRKEHNQAPAVEAGPDLVGGVGEELTLEGAVSDDGVPWIGNTPKGVTSLWSQVSGPGTVVFANGTSDVTTVACDTAGIYVLRLTAGDSDRTAYDSNTLRIGLSVAPGLALVVR